MDRATRRSADGRWPVDNGTHAFDVAAQQIQASSPGSATYAASPAAKNDPVLQIDEVTILTAWAEAVAEVLALAPERTESVLADAGAGAPWRSALGLPEPSARLGEAIDSMRRTVQAVMPPDGTATFDALLGAATEDRPGEERLDRMVRQVLLSTLEQRGTRTRPPIPVA